jgi:hypothetical protein
LLKILGISTVRPSLACVVSPNPSPGVKYNRKREINIGKTMALKEIPTVEDLAETTGQSREQLEKDREAAGKMLSNSDDE